MLMLQAVLLDQVCPHKNIRVAIHSSMHVPHITCGFFLWMNKFDKVTFYIVRKFYGYSIAISRRHEILLKIAYSYFTTKLLSLIFFIAAGSISYKKYPFVDYEHFNVNYLTAKGSIQVHFKSIKVRQITLLTQRYLSMYVKNMHIADYLSQTLRPLERNCCNESS